MQAAKDLLYVALEPITEESRIDKRAPISKYKWAVTLITYRGSKGNHTQIVIEGLNNGYNFEERGERRVEDGEYFISISEFNSSQDLKARLLPIDRKLHYNQRSETWIRKSERVKEMMDEIYKDKGNPPSLVQCGGNSIFSGENGHSCFSWAKTKLELINIDVNEKYGFGSLIPTKLYSWLFTVPHVYTQEDEKHMKKPLKKPLFIKI